MGKWPVAKVPLFDCEVGLTVNANFYRIGIPVERVDVELSSILCLGKVPELALAAARTMYGCRDLRAAQVLPKAFEDIYLAEACRPTSL